MLRHSRFDADEIEREKGVILEEMHMHIDTPRDHVGTVYEELLYGDQPLGWEILGREETIRAAIATRSSPISTGGTGPSAWSSASAAAGRRPDRACSRRSSATSSHGRPARPAPVELRRTARRSRSTRRSPTRLT